MAREYFKQAKFAAYRFQGKDAIKNHEAAYKEAKERDNFAGVKVTGKTRNVLERTQRDAEIFVQCWDCLSVYTFEQEPWPNRLKCPYCDSDVEVLTVDGKPVR